MTGKNKDKAAAEPQAATPENPEIGPDDNIIPSPHSQQAVEAEAEGGAPLSDDD